MRSWETRNGECHLIFEGHTGAVRSLALSKDGHTLWSASEDRTIRGWRAIPGTRRSSGQRARGRCGRARRDAATGACTATLTGHAFTVLTLALGRDAGGTLYSGSWDHTIRAWRCADGACVHVLGGATVSTDAVWALALTRDGTTMFSASSDCTVKCWRVALPKGCAAQCDLGDGMRLLLRLLRGPTLLDAATAAAGPRGGGGGRGSSQQLLVNGGGSVGGGRHADEYEDD